MMRLSDQKGSASVLTLFMVLCIFSVMALGDRSGANILYQDGGQGQAQPGPEERVGSTG